MNLHEPSFTTELEITTVQIGESESTISAEGNADKYGRVFVSWTLQSAGDRTGGTYSGSARTFPDDSTMIAAAFRGIWRRDGANLRIFSLDHADNGDQNLAIIDVDVLNRKAVATVYSLND